MTQQDGRATAREAVTRRMEELGLSQRRMAAVAGISTNTIARFLSGQSWPRSHQLAAIETALQWSSGKLTRLADGTDEPSDESKARRTAIREGRPTVDRSQEADGVVVALGPWADSLTDLERRSIEADVRAYALKLAVEWEEKSRNRRDEPAQ